jgi:hypothetical protein
LFISNAAYKPSEPPGHDAAGIVVFHHLVRPEIAAADVSAGRGDDRVSRLDEAGIGDIFDMNQLAPNRTVARIVFYFRFSAGWMSLKWPAPASPIAYASDDGFSSDTITHNPDSCLSPPVP